MDVVGESLPPAGWRFAEDRVGGGVALVCDSGMGDVGAKVGWVRGPLLKSSIFCVVSSDTA